MTETLPELEGLVCPVPLAHNQRIVMGHGSGGRMSFDLISKVFTSPLDNPILRVGDDAGVCSIVNDRQGNPSRLAISTDSHVVTPLFFPGGDIGRLAVSGTVNDVAMMGARPLYLTAGFILEEGLEVEILQRVVQSMRSTAFEAGVQIISGDTKVVQKGKADGMYINTTGLGILPGNLDIGGRNARPGDVIIISGSIGDHGIAVLAARGELNFESQVSSDVAPLNGLVAAMLAVSDGIHVLRDPTRGGLATSLNEIALQSNVGIQILDNAIPVKPAVAAACEMLGFDPLYVANEGKLVAFVDHKHAESVLAAMKNHPLGRDSSIIGNVVEGQLGRVTLKTGFGTTRMVDMLSGEMLPRIC